jgi:hypothetical protein
MNTDIRYGDHSERRSGCILDAVFALPPPSDGSRPAR